MQDITLPKDSREAKLPAWAQSLLRQTRAEVGAKEIVIAELQTALMQATGTGAEDSDTFIDAVDPATMQYRIIRLGRGTEVRFVPRSSDVPDGQRWLTVQVQDDGRLVVDSGQRLAVIPRAANSVELRVEKA